MTPVREAGSRGWGGSGDPASLKDRLAETIRREGPMTAYAFMERALYDPWGGYYMREHEVFGRSGDFYTAPDVHPVYGKTIAAWVADRTRQCGWTDVRILEFGAGTGRLAEQILAVWPEVGVGDLRYSIVEISPAWRQHQSRRLKPFESAVDWPGEMSKLDRGIVIAHELLDAMPVHLLRQGSGGLEEAWVDLGPGDQWTFRYAPASPEGRQAFEQWRPQVAPGCGFEVAPGAAAWVRDVLAGLGEGFVLIVDYGDDEDRLYGPHRPQGTLRAFYQHQCLDRWWDEPGERDITADVNFTILRRVARSAGGEVGFEGSLGQFLLSAGIARELSDCPPDQPFDPRARRNRAVKQLLLPGGFGEAFRVLEIRKGVGAAC